MKSISYKLAVLLCWLPLAIYANSPCDDTTIALIDHSDLNCHFVKVTTYHNSAIQLAASSALLAPGTPLQQEVVLQLVASPGKWGHARGDLDLQCQAFPEEKLSLHYSCIWITPYVSYNTFSINSVPQGINVIKSQQNNNGNFDFYLNS